MPVTRCTHLKINGTRCTMPAASGRELCFHHESRMLRQRAALPAEHLPSQFGRPARVPGGSRCHP